MAASRRKQDGWPRATHGALSGSERSCACIWNTSYIWWRNSLLKILFFFIIKASTYALDYVEPEEIEIILKNVSAFT